MTSSSEHKEVKSKLDDQTVPSLEVPFMRHWRPGVQSLAGFDAPICPQQGDPYSDELRVKAGTSAFTAHQVNLKQ